MGRRTLPVSTSLIGAAVLTVGACHDARGLRAGGAGSTKSDPEPAAAPTLAVSASTGRARPPAPEERAATTTRRGGSNDVDAGADCDPRELVRPDEGKTDRSEPPGLAGCPAGMAPVFSKSGVCVDRWEAHLVQVLDDGTERTWSPYYNPGSLRVRARSAPLAIPQGYVSRDQAAAACAASNKRLCTRAEWLAACRGSSKTRFPYGNTERLGTCNDDAERNPAAKDHEPQRARVFTALQQPCVNRAADALLPTGAKKECVSPEGVFDMVGNLDEWTAESAATFRGGYYLDTRLNGRGCDYVTTAHGASYWDFSTGFRCCASVAE